MVPFVTTRDPQVPRDPAASAWVWVAIAAFLVTILNAAKPMTVDDTAYYLQAANLVEHGFRPYSGTVFWYQVPQPAIEILAPPVFLYWLSGALALFGESPWIWKLALFPWLLGLGAATRYLVSRIAPGREAAAVCLLLFSPLVLPGVNLMLDMPALTLGLAAVALFWKGVERERISIVLWAGIAAGLAMQTKYTGISAMAGIAAFGLAHRSLREAILAGLAAATVFLAWEVFVYALHGTSQFLLALVWRGDVPAAMVNRLLVSCLTGFGLLASPLAGVAAALFTGRWIWVALAAALPAAAIVAMALLPPAEWAGDAFPSEFATIGPGGAAGLIAWAALIWAILRIVRGSAGAKPDRIGLALVLWLLIEIALTLLLSPFPAARRFIFLGAIALLVILRAAPPSREAGTPAPLGTAVAASALFGLFVWAVDLVDARNEQLAAREGARVAATAQQDGTGWFAGHWGFQYYARQAGLRALAPGRSRVAAGDLIVIPTAMVDRQQFDIEGAPLVEVARLRAGIRLPWSVKRGYYGGMHPIHAGGDARVPVIVYRASESFVPAPGD